MKDVILINNLFNGEYIKEKIGGEIINLYQSDNNKYYIYVNPHGCIAKKWDNRIKNILFIRSVGNGVVKVIGKAEIKNQINKNAKNNPDAGIDKAQLKYTEKNNISYGNVKFDKLASTSHYILTFEAKTVYKAKTDIYLTTKENSTYPTDSVFVLADIKRINNQSQKLYIEPSNINYKVLENILKNSNFWEKNTVGKVDLSKREVNTESFLSIIKKENDELVNSNLLAYFLENVKEFRYDFIRDVLKISDEKVIKVEPKITRESIGDIDLLIELGEYAIIIENKIKSGISNKKNKGYSQLEKYVNEANNHFDTSKTTLKFFILRPNYNNEVYNVNQYVEIKYSEIYKIMEKNSAIYKVIMEKQKIRLYFDEFKRVVKKHSAEYDNELYELMNERFIEKIKGKQEYETN